MSWLVDEGLHESRLEALDVDASASRWLVLILTAALGCSAETSKATAKGDSLDGHCSYPAGTPGYVPGDVPPSTLAWQGWAEQGGPSTVSISDYLDCDGSKGINALLVDQSAAWCGVCQTVAGKLAKNLREGWHARGIHVLMLLTQAADTTSATVETAREWKQRFELDGASVAADPATSFRDTFGEALAPYPYEVLIDPRTMQIVSVNAGYDGKGEFPEVVALAERNSWAR